MPPSEDLGSRDLDSVAIDAGMWFEDLHKQGVDITDNAHLKCAHEAKEFAEDPCLEEAADVFIALLGACHHRGWTPADLAGAAMDKLVINQGRTWVRQPDGTWQHA